MSTRSPSAPTAAPWPPAGRQQDPALEHHEPCPCPAASTLLAEDSAEVGALTFVHGGQSVLTADWDTQVSQWRVTDNAPTLAATLSDPEDPADGLRRRPRGQPG